MWRVWALLLWSCRMATAADEAVLSWQRSLASAAAYSVESAVQINAVERRDRELAYRITADLIIQPLKELQGDGDILLRFQLLEPQLLARGAHRSAEWEPRGSVWESHGGRAWFARLRRGRVRHLLLSPEDPPDVQNYKKALSSLFQIVSPDGGGNETDVSGECDVLYETLSDTTFRKIKRKCSGDSAPGVSARRLVRYEVGPGAGVPLLLYAEEVVTLHDTLKARSWHELSPRRAPSAPPAAPSAAELAALLEEPLTLHPPHLVDDDAPLDVDEAIREHRAALEGEEAGVGGAAEGARAALRLLPALRAASPATLLRALRDRSNRDVLSPLCRALGLAGSSAAVVAAREFLHLAARDPLEPLARAFLAGFALASAPQEEAVLDVLKLSEEARHAGVGESAALAAAGAVAGEGVGAAVRGAVRDAAVRALARCPGTEVRCRALRLAALGNMRADALEALVEHAERDAPDAALAALRALRVAPLLLPRHLERVGAVACNASAPLEVRAAALELVLVRRAASESPALPLQVLELARALHMERGRMAHELRRVLWQRVHALREAPPIRALLPLLPPELRAWDARAHAGTSSVLRRETGWGGRVGTVREERWGAALDSVQVAAGGLLRRGAVALLTLGPDGATTASPELEVEVWTRGLEAIAGGGGDDGGEAEVEAEGVAGGLAISVGGVRMPDIMLFDGQAELLGHIWSGTGSVPTGVVRALRARWGEVRVPLVGGAWLVGEARAAAALAMDAHAAVSLWGRTARGALELRAGVAAEWGARVRTAWSEMRATRARTLEPRLAIAFDLDFYDGVALCVRASSPDHEAKTNLEMESVMGARRWRVRRGESQRHAAPGRTLALDRRNDAACRTLRPADGDD